MTQRVERGIAGVPAEPIHVVQDIEQSAYQPGLGPVRYNTQFLGRDNSFSGISPFVSERGPERNYQYGFGMGGGLIKDKSGHWLVNSWVPKMSPAVPNGSVNNGVGQ